MKPVLTKDFGQASHRIKMFDAVVPVGTKPEELTDPKLWGNVARNFDIGCEIRVLCEDYSYRAQLLCTYVQGSELRLTMIQFNSLDIVSYDEIISSEEYMIKQRGISKWCIIKKSTGEVIQEKIATQAEAYKQLEDYKRALAA